MLFLKNSFKLCQVKLKHCVVLSSPANSGFVFDVAVVILNVSQLIYT